MPNENDTTITYSYSFNVPNVQPLEVNPETTEQEIIAPDGVSGYSPITIKPVTASIDSNIEPENIKEGVTILDVTGTSTPLIAKSIHITKNGTYVPESPYNAFNEVEVKVSNYLVQVIDYDGTVLKSEILNEGDTFTLPSNPSHSGLVFQGWSSPVTITNNAIIVGNSDITIGAMYTTASGLSEFDITLTPTTGLNITFNMNGTKNWGDGTSDASIFHTYSDYGDYTITCDGNRISPSTDNNGYNFMGQVSNNSAKFSLKAARLTNITRISGYTFWYCSSLSCITISNTTTEIGRQAFGYCNSLKSVTIPNGVTNSVGNEIFYSCPSLKSVTIPTGTTSVSGFECCSSLASITIPDTVTSIGTYAFSGCNSLKSVTIPNSVTNINEGAFQSCGSLVSIIIPEGITSIKNYTFNSCNSLASITIPDTVTSIGNYAFQNCYSLASITLPSTVTSIGTYAFKGCSALASINIPDTVTSISEGVFQNCSSLASVNIPEGITSIGESSFYNCIPIIEYDFSKFISVPTLSFNAFYGINGICQIKVPANLEADWKAAERWSDYANYIVGV